MSMVREKKRENDKCMHRSLDGKRYMRYGLKLSGLKNRIKVASFFATFTSQVQLAFCGSKINALHSTNHQGSSMYIYSITSMYIILMNRKLY